MYKTINPLYILVTILATYSYGGSAEESQKIRPLSELETIQYANETLKVTKGNFSCAGIGVFNGGFDGPIYFFKNDSRELICISSMGGCIEADEKKQSTCECPPLKWRANNCDIKYKNR